MYAKELFRLKPGTYIKGLWVPERKTMMINGEEQEVECFVSFRVGGWRGTKPPCINTFFLSQVHGKLVDGKTALDMINGKVPIAQESSDALYTSKYLSVRMLTPGEPVAVLLGEYLVAERRDLRPYKNRYAVYSRVLTPDGLVGYMILDTPDFRTEELMLI